MSWHNNSCLCILRHVLARRFISPYSRIRNSRGGGGGVGGGGGELSNLGKTHQICTMSRPQRNKNLIFQNKLHKKPYLHSNTQDLSTLKSIACPNIFCHFSIFDFRFFPYKLHFFPDGMIGLLVAMLVCLCIQ